MFTVMKKRVLYLFLVLAAAVFFFGVMKAGIYAAEEDYYWGEESTGQTQGWFVQNEAGMGVEPYNGALPEDFSGSTIWIFAKPNNTLLSVLENLKGNDVSVMFYSQYDAEDENIVIGKEENGLILENVYFVRKNNNYSLTINADIKFQLTLDSMANGRGDVVVNGDIWANEGIGNLRLESLWRNGDVTVNGKVGKVYFCKKNTNALDHEDQMKYFGSNCTITGSVDTGIVSMGVWNNNAFEYPTANRIGRCSEGVFRITGGVLDQNVPLNDVENSGYYYFFQTTGAQNPDGSFSSWNWMKTKVEADTRQEVGRYFEGVSLNDLADGDELRVGVPEVEVEIDKKLRSLRVEAGTVVFNGSIVTNSQDVSGAIYYLPLKTGECNLTLNCPMDGVSLVITDKGNAAENLIVNSAVELGSYRKNSRGTYFVFSCPANTQLIKDGKWNSEIPLVVPGTSFQVRDIPTEEAIGNAVGTEEGVGSEYSVSMNGEQVTIVKKASMEITKAEINEEEETQVIEAVEEAGLGADITAKAEVKTVLNIDINTWFEKKNSGDIYNDENYGNGNITQLASGKTLTVPFKIEDYSETDSYKVVRKHTEPDGSESTAVLETKKLGNGWYSFDSDRFSQFIVVRIPGDATETMYRLYNPNSGEHFYTKEENERNTLIQIGWRDEGIGWTGPSKGKPVYRLYNRNAGDHHYTMDERERAVLIEIGWEDEGICWYSANEEGGKPLYRLYNPNCIGAGAHHYTAYEHEKDVLIQAGWRDEDIAWYGYY